MSLSQCSKCAWSMQTLLFSNWICNLWLWILICWKFGLVRVEIWATSNSFGGNSVKTILIRKDHYSWKSFGLLQRTFYSNLILEINVVTQIVIQNPIHASRFVEVTCNSRSFYSFIRSNLAYCCIHDLY